MNFSRVQFLAYTYQLETFYSNSWSSKDIAMSFNIPWLLIIQVESGEEDFLSCHFLQLRSPMSRRKSEACCLRKSWPPALRI
uniref:Uncharacterized protein n=1 Tax=Pyxicephalus adspersus TaxID=30357 RepID=A0AAV2ZP51_PYXAD|nr:TPA: hypothetical protein GDO54_003324 [Pyxicephalus adspersus]